jgi:putative hydrolase of the HAD superfamily
MMKNTIEHIFFDLDNTIWDFDANSRLVLTDLFLEFNLENRCGVKLEEFIQEYEKINHILWDRLRKNEITKEQLRSSRFYNSMQSFGYDDFELGYTLEEEYVKRSPYQKILVPDAIEVLKKLSHNFKLHIITNGFREVQHIKIDNCGIKEYFSNIFISEEIGFSKPDKKIFEFSLKSACSRLENSIMVGDDLNIDVIGAINCGMRAIHFDRSENLKEDSSDILKINQLKQIFNYI